MNFPHQLFQTWNPVAIFVNAVFTTGDEKGIDLINGGQVFRFLLKPIKAKQTSIWIESAVGKHVELVNNPELLARHAVADEAGSSLRKLGDQLVGIVSRVMRFRDRVTQANQA